MFTLILEWKEFSVNLPMIEAFCKGLDSNCVGTSADSALRVHFSEEPTQETKDAIQAKWDGLDEESDEVSSYKSQSQIDAAIQAAKLALISKTWATMNTSEKKLVVGLMPSLEELIEDGIL